MNFLTHILHLAGSGVFAYYSAAQIRDSKTRPNILAGFQLAESGSVPFLSALRVARFWRDLNPLISDNLLLQGDRILN